MIVTNRKLFKKRPARDRLNQAAGIMASSPELMGEVQGFQAGGPVILETNREALFASQQDPTNTFLGSDHFYNKDTGNYMGYPVYKAGKIIGFQSEPPLARTITRTEVPENIRTRPFNVTEGQLKEISNIDPMSGYEQSIRNLIENPTKRGGELSQTIEEALENAIIGSTKGVAGLTNKVLKDLYQYDPSYLEELSETILDQTPTGIDLAEIPGSGVGRTVNGQQVFQPGVVTQTGYGETKGQPPSQEVYNMLDINQPIGPGADPNEINQIIKQAQDISRNQELERFREIDRASVKKAEEFANRGQDKEAATADLLQEAQDKEVFDFLEGQKKKEFRKTEEARLQDKQFFEKPESEEAKEAIVDQTDKFVQTTTGSDLDDLMQAFISKAPDYKGVDKGMAIAKIGFAIAAGKSPDGIQNIAEGLSMGADMLMKDDADRDAFNRQVQLAALQYGLGEISKEKAEQRLLNRARQGFENYTFGPEGGEYRGKQFGPYATVPILKSDILDNNVPDGLVDSSIITALTAKNAAITKTMQKLVEDKVLSGTEEDTAQKDYASAVDTAIKAERGIALTQGVLLNVADNGVTGIGPAFDTVYARAKRLVGIESKITTLEDARKAMRQLLQGIVPVTLGRDQSANSISNRDIDFLITAYFGEGALDPGSFNFVLTSKEELIGKLQAAASAMQQAQVSDFNRMNSIEVRLKDKIIKGTLSIDATGGFTGKSALELLAPSIKTLEQANLTRVYEGDKIGGAVGTGSGINWSRGEDGLINIKLPGEDS